MDYTLYFIFFTFYDIVMLINEFSKRTGVTVHTIRYYENLGLITGKTDDQVQTNNYKYYDELAVERLEIILEAKEVGFTLAQTRELLDSWYDKNSPASAQIKLLSDKINEVEFKIKQFRQMKKRLETAVRELKSGQC